MAVNVFYGSAGGRQFHDFCDEGDIKYETCGKPIVTIGDSEVPRLAEHPSLKQS